MFTDINKRLRIRFFYFIAEIPDSQVKSSIRFGRPPRKQDNHNPQSIFGRSKLKSNFARPCFQGLRNLRVNVITLEQYQLFMPYEYVEFDINPPIGEAIGKVPEHIKPIYENGAITKLQVILGEERTETIKKSNHFKKISNEISGIDFVNLLEQEIRDYATQRAKDFINQVNFKLDSPRYKVQLTTLAVLQLQRYLSTLLSKFWL